MLCEYSYRLNKKTVHYCIVDKKNILIFTQFTYFLTIRSINNLTIFHSIFLYRKFFIDLLYFIYNEFNIIYIYIPLRHPVHIIINYIISLLLD